LSRNAQLLQWLRYSVGFCFYLPWQNWNRVKFNKEEVIQCKWSTN
jgi:hypothetical protein